MKKDFFDYLDKLMEKNEDIYFLYGDLGYPRVGEFKQKYPDRVFNCGASEQTMMDMSVGLAYAGKIPVTYTITPFYWRAAETLRTYISHEKLKVIMIGAGQDEDYSIHDGFSHDAKDIKMLTFKKIGYYKPQNLAELKFFLNNAIKYSNPAFINIKR